MKRLQKLNDWSKIKWLWKKGSQILKERKVTSFSTKLKTRKVAFWIVVIQIELCLCQRNISTIELFWFKLAVWAIAQQVVFFAPKFAAFWLLSLWALKLWGFEAFRLVAFELWAFESLLFWAQIGFWLQIANLTQLNNRRQFAMCFWLDCCCLKSKPKQHSIATQIPQTQHFEAPNSLKHFNTPINQTSTRCISDKQSFSSIFSTCTFISISNSIACKVQRACLCQDTKLSQHFASSWCFCCCCYCFSSAARSLRSQQIHTKWKTLFCFFRVGLGFSLL